MKIFFEGALHLIVRPSLIQHYVKTLCLVVLLILIAEDSFAQNNDIIFGCGFVGAPPPPSPQPEGNLNCNYDFESFRANHVDDMVPSGVTRTLKIRTNVIFVQDLNGAGNFQKSNPEHIAFFNEMYAIMNARLAGLVKPSCGGCMENPVKYSNIHLEFVPNFIEVKHATLWNHRNDPEPSDFDSYNKTYLNQINALAAQSPGYMPGFNVIITTDGFYYDKLVNQDPPRKPVWDLGYSPSTDVYQGFWYSGYPTYDLTHPAMWHAPDMYLVYLNSKEFIGDWYVQLEKKPQWAGGFLHEYGHYFNLGHQNCSNANVMSSAGSLERNSLTGCQVRIMYETLMTKTLRQYVICEDVLEYDLKVDNAEVWTSNLRVFGNIVIKSGGSLTVACELHMSPKTKIIVERGGKLILDNGALLTGCGEFWDGIIVEGDAASGSQAAAGRVELKNQSIIENAKIAISMNPSHREWANGAYQTYYGGYLKAEGATIRDGYKAVEFMKYGTGTIKDGSYFLNCSFRNLREGVTIWSDNGVSFDHCAFTNIVNRGIQPYDSDAKVVNGCTFTNMKTGVDIITTYPVPFAPQIGSIATTHNTFNCQEHGIFANASGNIEKLNILNNTFSGGQVGVELSGISHFEINRNLFENQAFNIVPIDAGFNPNYIKQNEMDGTVMATHNIYNNTGLQYLENCFSNNWYGDIFMNDGSIFPNQGSQTTAAGNCFTKNGVPEIDNSDGQQLDYFVKQGTAITSCKYPQGSYNIQVRAISSSENLSSCGVSMSPGSANPNFSSNLPCNFDESMTIAQLQSAMSLINNDLSTIFNTSGAERQVAEYRKCLKSIIYLIGKKGYSNLDNDPDGGREQMITFFGNLPSFEHRILAYGLMLHGQQLSRARAYLAGLVATTPEEIDFKTVQNLNLDYLADTKKYTLTMEVKNLLYQIGRKALPYSGYARSLYQVLSGERLELEKPSILYATSRSDGKHESVGRIYSAPNPVVNGKHTIFLPTEFSKEYSVEVTDYFGRRMLSSKSFDRNEFEVNTVDYPNGLYTISVLSSLGEIRYHAKIVVINQ